jgi:hypothetical protein
MGVAPLHGGSQRDTHAPVTVSHRSLASQHASVEQ